jgi:hypothetical protein
VHAPPSGAQNPPPPPAPSVVGVGPGGGASHEPFVQLEVQQSAPVTHVPPDGVHTVVHVLVAASQCFEQQSASLAHVAFSPLQRPFGAMHRGGS